MSDSTTKANSRLMKLVSEALATPELEMRALIVERCAGDTDLFDEVWSRVQAELRMKEFLSKPLFPGLQLQRPFEPGQLLGGRFRTVGLVGEGGMAFVYKAIDERLEDREIAIKCAKPGFQRHLPPEVLSACAISHPNVCNVYEIHTTSTPYGVVDFLTMEYLEGETLSARIKRQGPLSLAATRDLARQLCAGLEEAHRKGVIHGDFKSSNVILVQEGGRTQAVITDFGLAHSVLEGSGSGRRSRQGGTPDYMAPELFKGSNASVASDIYALGVTLYECLYGHRPNKKPNKRKDAGPPLKTKVGGRLLHPFGSNFERTITRCLEAEPVRRPASAAAVYDHLSRKIPAGRIVAAAALILASLGMADRPIHPLRNSVRLALLPFETTNDDDQSLADGLLIQAGTLLTQSKASGWISTIPVSDAISRSRVTTPERARAVLGATHVLNGTLQRQGDIILLQAAVTDTHTLQALKHEPPFQYARGDLGRMPLALAAVVTTSLRLPPVKSGDVVNAAAFQDYSGGLAHLQNEHEVDQAIASLERASRLDRDSPLVKAALAEAYFSKYRLTRATQELERAREAARDAEAINPDIPAVRLIAGMLKYDSGVYAEAAEDFRRAVELDPQDAQAHWRLALAYNRLNQPQEALAAYQKAIDTQPGYYRPYQELGTFFYKQGKYEPALEQYRKVAALIPGWPEGHDAIAVALIRLGKCEEAENEMRIVLNLDGEYAYGTEDMGIALLCQGREKEAIPYFKQAVETRPNSLLPWLNLGDAYRRSNLPAEARDAYQKALVLAHLEVRRAPRKAYERASLAYLLARLGDSQSAQFEISQALALGADDQQAQRLGVRTYEALGLRSEALNVLEGVPYVVLVELRSHPDMADLGRDSRFLQLLSRKNPQ